MALGRQRYVAANIQLEVRENGCDLSRLLVEQHRKEHLKQAYGPEIYLLSQSAGMAAVLRRERNQSIDERHTRTLHCRGNVVVTARLALEEACFSAKSLQV